MHRELSAIGKILFFCSTGFLLKNRSLFFLTSIDEDPVVVISTFVPDKTHPAGLLALKIVRLSVIKISQKCHEIVIML
jgi:hypothetical protein